MPSENTTDSSTTENLNTPSSPSQSSTQDPASSFGESLELCHELMQSLQELNKAILNAEMHPDGCFEDETEIHEKLLDVGSDYYSLHDEIFERIAWTSQRRKTRLNPQLYSTPGGRPKGEGDQPHMSRDELDSVLKKLGL
jgi:hypothetical protein